MFVLLFLDFYLQECQACNKRNLHNMLPYNNFYINLSFFFKYRCPTFVL